MADLALEAWLIGQPMKEVFQSRQDGAFGTGSDWLAGFIVGLPIQLPPEGLYLLNMELAEGSISGEFLIPINGSSYLING